MSKQYTLIGLEPRISTYEGKQYKKIDVHLTEPSTTGAGDIPHTFSLSDNEKNAYLKKMQIPAIVELDFRFYKGEVYVDKLIEV